MSALFDIRSFWHIGSQGELDASRKDIGPIASRGSLAYHRVCTTLVPRLCRYSFRHTLERIKRKTHGRTRARESSCCVRPFRGGQERAVSKGVARMSLCTLPDLIKGPFATDGWLFAGDFVKDFSVVDGPGSAHAPVIVVYSFFSASEDIPADLLSIVLLLIDRNFISITSYFNRSQAGSFDLRRLRIPLAVSVQSTLQLYTLHLHSFSIFRKRMKDTFIILNSNKVKIAARYSYDQ